MPSWTKSDLIAYQSRNPIKPATTAEPVKREKDLHEAILEYCAAQWPRWKTLHARMDKRSTIQVGAQDLTIFMPAGRTLCIECKARNEKPTPEQQAWGCEMVMLGHTVHVVRSMDEFLNVLKD